MADMVTLTCALLNVFGSERKKPSGFWYVIDRVVSGIITGPWLQGLCHFQSAEVAD